jgi:hypothetical protein
MLENAVGNIFERNKHNKKGTLFAIITASA